MRFLCGLLFAGVLCAQTRFFPLQDIRPGMRGTGKTVFAGNRIEDFQVEILGVLENVGPKQSLILARLSGGPLAETGVLAGMSGSPVYIEGRLAGAVAMTFAFSKEPITAIRPIEEMVCAAGSAARQSARIHPALWDGKLAGAVPPREDVMAAGGRMVDIATPVSFGGFTRNAIERFAPELRALGLEPRQGMAGGGRPTGGVSPAGALQAGSMITVELLSGDMSIAADGTVTYIDGQKIYAFGHRLLAIGATDLPLARADVIALLPNLSTSFKISATREWVGAITDDRDTAIAGELGRRARTIPVSVSVVRHAPGLEAGRPITYEMRMVNDSILSPTLLQMAVFSAIDATERMLGDATFAIHGEVEFENGAAPLKLNNMYAGDFNLAAQVALGAAAPVAYATGSGFDALQLKRITLQIDSFSRKRELRIDQLWSSRRQVRPGESVDLHLELSGDNGIELMRKVTYRVPAGAPTGPLQFTAADANSINLTEYGQLLSAPPKSASQLISFINSLRPNTNAYVEVWRALPSYEVEGRTLPDPPPSAAMILRRAQPPLSGMATPANSKIAEFEVGGDGMVVSGSKTIQVEVKE